MPSRKEGLLVLYPEYFDSRLSRKQGRRVPKSLAREAPTMEAVLNAARTADPALEPRSEPKKSFSARWHEKRGRVLVKRRFPKQKTLLLVARKLG
jgi:signal recognition particle subunit SRP19